MFPGFFFPLPLPILTPDLNLITAVLSGRVAAVALTPALNPAQPFSINLAVIFLDDPLIFCNTAQVHPNNVWMQFFFTLEQHVCQVSDDAASELRQSLQIFETNGNTSKLAW